MSRPWWSRGVLARVGGERLRSRMNELNSATVRVSVDVSKAVAALHAMGVDQPHQPYQPGGRSGARSIVFDHVNRVVLVDDVEIPGEVVSADYTISPSEYGRGAVVTVRLHADSIRSLHSLEDDLQEIRDVADRHRAAARSYLDGLVDDMYASLSLVREVP